MKKTNIHTGTEITDVVKDYWRSGKTILLSVLIGKIFAVIWKLLLARLGPESLGTVEIALTVFFTLGSFTLLGFQSSLMRFVAIALHNKSCAKPEAYFFFSLRIGLIAAAVIILVCIITPSLLPALVTASASELKIVQKYLWVIPIYTFSELALTYLGGIKATRSYAIGKYILPALFRLMFLLVFMYFGLNGSTLVGHIVSSMMMISFVIWIFLQTHLKRVTQNLTKKDIRAFLTFTIPMSGSFLMYVAYGAGDVLLVGKYLGTESVGLLSATNMFIDIPDMLLMPMLAVFQAYLGSLYASPRRGLNFAMHNIKIFLLVGSVIGLGIYAFRFLGTSILLGSQYASITPLISWLLFSKILESAIILPLRHVLDFYGHVYITLYLMIIGTMTKIGIGFLVLPHLGLSGIIVLQWTGAIVHCFGVLIASWILIRRANAPIAQK